MKKYILSLFLCCCMYAAAERVEPYSGARIFWDTSTRTSVFSGSYARMLLLQDGRLLLVTEQSGNIVGAFSNNGSMWGTQFTIATAHDNINMCVPDLIQLTDGTIIVAYNPRPKTPYTEDRKFGIRCKRSTDNGSTWSEEIFVNDATYDYYNGCWEPSMLELPSGELHLYFADEEPYPSTGYGDQQISLCRSFDEGLTWTEPQKVSYRAGSRDGMPVPILSTDGSEIIVAIEDNGWGYGDFFPTTVRCSLADNWGNDYFVDANSANRERTLDFDYCPVVTGGAPYLRKLADGETVLSWQSSYGSSVNKMWVAVGDAEARHFKALTKPFITSASEVTQWNSLAVVDTVVYAIGTVAGSIEVERGYPKKQFEAALGSPTVDGSLTTNEGYYTSNGTQVRLGGQTGTVALCDFAYDKDSLYFYCRVTDSEQIESGSYQDCVTLCIDVDDTSDTRPATGTYKYIMRLTEQVMAYYGNGTAWRTLSSSAVHCTAKQSRAYYIIEAAVPWSEMGLTAPPMNRMAVNIEVQNGSTSSKETESIPDAEDAVPYTWMTLHLQDVETGIRTVPSTPLERDVHISIQGKQLSISSDSSPIESVRLFSVGGQCLAQQSAKSNSVVLLSPAQGLLLVQINFADGGKVTRRVLLL